MMQNRFLVGCCLVVSIAALVPVTGCGDPGLAPAKTSSAMAADGSAGGDLGSSDAASSGDSAPAPDATDPADAPQGSDVEPQDSQPDATADAAAADSTPQQDSGSLDATASDSAAQDSNAPDASPSDAGAVDPACPACLFSKQPPAPHPGGPGALPLAPAETIDYSTGMLDGYKQILVIRPNDKLVHPTVLFVAGKQLYEGGGFPAKLGYPYRAFLEQIASHGYVVAFVRVEQGLMDADHLRMADDLLAASTKLFDKITLANPDKVAYVGHSMGAKVVMLAAWRATAGDTQKQHADPRAVLAFAVSNEAPPIGTFQNAVDKVKLIGADVPTWFTFATGADDDIAPWSDPKKANAKDLYEALQTPKKQLIVLQGTGKDDLNPPTTPELVDDHSAPLSIEGKPGGMADLAMPPSHLDALDWYGYWKWTVGALDYHFSGGDPVWAYGELRTHGGHLPDGTLIKHQLISQGWTSLPAP